MSGGTPAAAHAASVNDTAEGRPSGLAGGVRVRGLRRAFSGREILHGADLDLALGEFVALLGASGSGKSTLLRAVAGAANASARP